MCGRRWLWHWLGCFCVCAFCVLCNVKSHFSWYANHFSQTLPCQTCWLVTETFPVSQTRRPTEERWSHGMQIHISVNALCARKGRRSGYETDRKRVRLWRRRCAVFRLNIECGYWYILFMPSIFSLKYLHESVFWLCSQIREIWLTRLKNLKQKIHI